mgnify:CR=1 FL=1
MTQRVYIKTFGCQMNEHDSQRMLDLLAASGYLPAAAPEEAALIVLNTCSVRHNPENKVFSFLGTLRGIKQQRPETVVAVAGCVAQQEGRHILQRESLVDLVFGPDQMFRLPELLDRVRAGERVCATEWLPHEGRTQNFIPEEWVERGHVEGFKAYIAITKGCNNLCSFCIVPRTRGREVSREPENILRDARSLAARGAKEIWLLGQNVNSYRAADGYGFYELLDAVSQIGGLARLRFTSPHPKDWNNALSDLMAARPAICKQLHLPFQAGADPILKAMRRRHTVAEYLDKVRYLRGAVPEVEISTDLIVGFPGETDEHFEGTLAVLREVRFSQVFPFKYSPRPDTAAAKLPDDVPRKTKEARLARVIELQEAINRECQQALVGTEQEVLLDAKHPRKRGWMNGRTDGYRSIAVKGEGIGVGDIVRVRVTGHEGHWLVGEVY